MKDGLLKKSILGGVHIFGAIRKMCMLPFRHEKYQMDSEEAEVLLQKYCTKPVVKCVCHNEREIPAVIDLRIIVPAYNVENYIEECLDSILSQQTSYKVETWVVEDGSTDDTAKLLKKYKEKSGLKVIFQKNGGTSAARNLALQYLDCKYLMFVDADDKLEKNAVQHLLDSAFINDAEIVEGSYYTFKKSSKKIYMVKAEEHANPFRTLNGYPWGKVFKVELFEKVCFPVGVWFEDTMLPYLILPIAQKVVMISDIVYGYRQNNTGMSERGKKNAKCLDTWWITEGIMSEMKELRILMTQDLYEQVLHQLVLNSKRIVLMDKDVRKAVFSLSCDLLANEFLMWKSRNVFHKRVEKALRTRDWGQFCLLCDI
ncbi:MAG: glycosyltransferase family 2 protein [Lachnospiraceae bacterium]|nr:glycosyltransferase family 2 protein [Lachnospiraceae bacterium]